VRALTGILALALICSPVLAQSDAQPAAEASDTRPQVGLGFWPHSSGIEVNAVSPGSAAAEAGIKSGMIITHANGKALTGMSITEVEKYVGGIKGEITFKIIGKGDVTLRKAPIKRR